MKGQSGESAGSEGVMLGRRTCFSVDGGVYLQGIDTARRQ
jgi:hypothetical protein